MEIHLPSGARIRPIGAPFRDLAAVPALAFGKSSHHLVGCERSLVMAYCGKPLPRRG
jgi:hypothetical protein